VGLLFAWCARQQFTGGAAPWGRELAAVLSFEAIILWPVAIYYYMVYPDWSWMYFVDPHRLPWGVGLLVMIGYVATLLGGWLGGWALLRIRKEKLLYGAMGALGLTLAMFAIACRGRLGAAGSYSEYYAGHAPLVREGKLAWALPVTAVGMAASIALVGFTLREQGKRFRQS
jgi:hypothetical protein